MNSLKATEKGLEIGAAVTFTDLSKKLKELIHSMPGNLCYVHRFLSGFIFCTTKSSSYEGICCDTGNVEVVCRSTDKECRCECALQEHHYLCLHVHTYVCILVLGRKSL